MCKAVYVDGEYVDSTFELSELLKVPVVMFGDLDVYQDWCLCCCDIETMAKNAGLVFHGCDEIGDYIYSRKEGEKCKNT